MSQYNKYPKTKVKGYENTCVQGYEDIINDYKNVLLQNLLLLSILIQESMMMKYYQ